MATAAQCERKWFSPVWVCWKRQSRHGVLLHGLGEGADRSPPQCGGYSASRFGRRGCWKGELVTILSAYLLERAVGRRETGVVDVDGEESDSIPSRSDFAAAREEVVIGMTVRTLRGIPLKGDVRLDGEGFRAYPCSRSRLR